MTSIANGGNVCLPSGLFSIYVVKAGVCSPGNPLDAGPQAFPPYFSLAACSDLLNLATKRLTPDSLKLHLVTLFIAILGQESANILSASQSLSNPGCCSAKKARDNTQTTRLSFVQIKLYLQSSGGAWHSSSQCHLPIKLELSKDIIQGHLAEAFLAVRIRAR